MATYWNIGRHIVERQHVERYGSSVIERLSTDLRARFPGQRGFSVRNLHYMRSFAAAWPDREILQKVLQNLGWGQIQLLLDKLDDQHVRDWYARRSLTDGWTHGIMADRISAQLHLREGAAPSNFPTTASDVDHVVLDRLATDPYRLDFIALGPGVGERSLEDALTAWVTEFLTHLGTGFAYMGRQYRVEVGGDEFFIDLLFYNTQLHRYVVFEVKSRPFRPSDVGQLNFYVTAVERTLRSEKDSPTIGVLLVTGKNRVVVEYSLASIGTPMTVANYAYDELPPDVRSQLPAGEELAHAIEDTMHEGG